MEWIIAMPFKSDAQRKFMNANKGKIGSSVVNEFNKASKGLMLPQYSAPKMPGMPKTPGIPKEPKVKKNKFNFLEKMKEFK